MAYDPVVSEIRRKKTLSGRRCQEILRFANKLNRKNRMHRDLF
jgi:hypothetical protein